MAARLDVHLERARVGAILRCRGEVDLASCDELVDALDRALATRPRSVVLDLSELRFIDASGVRCLLRFAHRCRAEGTTFTTRASRPVRRVLDVLGLRVELRAS